MTHADLVDVARRWLIARKPGPWGTQWHHTQASVVVTEISSSWEQPDAIGWHSGLSTLIECKTSVSDFKKDAEKPFRREPDRGLGRARFFLTPEGLLRNQVLPDGWGLLETNGRRVKVIRDSKVFAFDEHAEKYLLLSVLQRVAIVPDRSISLTTYTLQTKSRASLTVVDGPVGQMPDTVESEGVVDLQQELFEDAR